jgi:tetratricopeptide (TPR) repeat protein
MKKENILLGIIILIVGLLVGVIISKSGSRSTLSSPAGPPAVVDVQRDIAFYEDEVARNPSNRNAWVQLGNLYFGSREPVKSIEAYEKALELNRRDPNVLTDQGTMFRELGWYDRALDNFYEAQKIDPNHPQSLFNLGVVYRYDLHDFPLAHDAWSRFVQLHPNSPGAERLLPELEFLRSQAPH